MATSWLPDTRPCPLDDAHRCTGTVKNGEYAGERCAKARVGGIHGTVCASHGLNGRARAAAARRAQFAQARDDADTYGRPREIDPRAALEEELWRTAGIVDFYLLIVQSLERDELKQDTYDGDGRRWERPAVWVELLDRERRQLVTVAKQAAAAGVEERRTELLEAQGALLGQLLRGILEDLGLADDPDAHRVVARRLHAIDGGAAA